MRGQFSPLNHAQKQRFNRAMGSAQILRGTLGQMPFLLGLGVLKIDSGRESRARFQVLGFFSIKQETHLLGLCDGKQRVTVESG